MHEEQYIIEPDAHGLVGRLYDLSIVKMHFDTYEEAFLKKDVAYVIKVYDRLSFVVDRGESLNVVGNMLWAKHMPRSFKKFPVSRHQWLNIIADTFLMRLISVKDCAAFLVSEIFELDLQNHCSVDRLRKRGVPADVLFALSKIADNQFDLRLERNERIHEGIQREFSDHDGFFRSMAFFEKMYGKVNATDQSGQPISIEGLFVAGLNDLRLIFNPAVAKLEQDLHDLFDLLLVEFDTRFTAILKANGVRLPRTYDYLPSRAHGA